MTPDEAAAQAIQLYYKEARLCEVSPQKVPRINSVSSEPPLVVKGSTRFHFYFFSIIFNDNVDFYVCFEYYSSNSNSTSSNESGPSKSNAISCDQKTLDSSTIVDMNPIDITQPSSTSTSGSSFNSNFQELYCCVSFQFCY